MANQVQMFAGRIAVVDERNRFVRWEARRAVHEQRLVHRSIHVLLWDSGGRLLVQRRHRNKQVDPHHWDVSCAGHVEESDYTGGPDEELDAAYATAAARELEEELGVRVPLRRIGRFGPGDGVVYEQAQLFEARSDGPFRLQAEEVEAHRLLTRPETEALLASGEPVTPALRWFLKWVRDRHCWPSA